jgi:hypothetical protein
MNGPELLKQVYLGVEYENGTETGWKGVAA